jgi:uncharacterized integral membrane protein
LHESKDFQTIAFHSKFKFLFSLFQMSVITAVILGSLICGLLLVIAAGCGLRLYHLRVALEQRWSTIRLQQRTVQ